MGSQVRGDTIESLIQERRDTQAEAKLLQERIDQLLIKRQKIANDSGGSDPEVLETLDRQIEELTQEKRERSSKLKNICRMARTISAGD